MSKPELGDIAVGDKLIVIPCIRGRYDRREPREVVVTKAARVWIEMKSTSDDKYNYTWRMRRDTQDEGGQHSPAWRFATVEQKKWEDREREASRFLDEAGIEFSWKRSRYKGDKVTLANIIRKHEGLPEI
jgi:hypothetical protein